MAGDEPPVVESAREEWRTSTTALERVRQLVEQTTEPVTAAEMADRALVSEPTARKHLESLVEVGVAESIEDGRATTYRRDEDSILYRRIRDLATEHPREELIDRIGSLKQQISEYRASYDAESPTELAAKLEEGTESEEWKVVSEWQTAERNLYVVQAAVNYGRARDLGTATQ